MNRPKRTRRLSAAVFIYLALNIQVKDEGSPDWLLAIPLLPLNLFLWGWWRLRLILKRGSDWSAVSFARCEQTIASFCQNGGVALALVGIGCKASLYGLGVTR